MSAACKKATNQVITRMNEKYEELDKEFVDFIRGAIEGIFKPLLKGVGKEKKPRGVTAFNLYVSEYIAKHIDDAPVMDANGKVLSNFKRAGMEWKAASADVRASYQTKAVESNVANGIVPDAPKPKKPINGYNAFVKEYKIKNADKLQGGPGLFKQASAQWKSMTLEQREVYKQQAIAENAANGVSKISADASSSSSSSVAISSSAAVSVSA